MPNYILTLTLAHPGDSRDHRRLKAREKAKNVTVNNIHDNNGTVTWDVTGTPTDVCEMIHQWRRHPNVTHVTSEPPFDCQYLG
jgi:hypothetical protein